MPSRRPRNHLPMAALLTLDLLSKAVPLVVFPAVVRALGPTAYGKVGFATAVAGFFGLLAGFGQPFGGVGELLGMLRGLGAAFFGEDRSKIAGEVFEFGG